jgi:hypothetical protein
MKNLCCGKKDNKQWKIILLNGDAFSISFFHFLFVCIFLQVGDVSCKFFS